MRNYVHTYELMKLLTYVPIVFYLHTTNVPTYLNYLHAYLLTNLHTCSVIGHAICIW
jgi:hypothetical protein